jgi:hypothetical protein
MRLFDKAWEDIALNWVDIICEYMQRFTDRVANGGFWGYTI